MAALLTLSLAAGCSSAPKPVLERAWIGGEYDRHKVAVPTAAQETAADAPWRQGVLVTAVYPGTPVAQAGVQPGDVVLSVGDTRVRDVAALHREIEQRAPGDTVELQIYRQGGTSGGDHTQSVVVGVEEYQRYGMLTLGLGLSPRIDLLPTPDFNLLGLVRFTKSRAHPQLASPRARLRRALATEPPREIGRGWSFWFLVFGLGKRDEVQAQRLSAEPSARE